MALKMFRIPRPLRWLALALLALLTLEFCARFEDWWRQGASFLRPYAIESVFRWGDVGKEGRPGAHFGKWAMNSMGYRSPEPTPGKRRVLTFGASETFGIYETPGDEFPRQVERVLQERGLNDVEVVNIALPGMRIGHTDYLERAIRDLKPSWVVIYPTPATYIGVESSFCGRHSTTYRSPPVMPNQIFHFRLAGKVEQLVKKTVPLSVLVKAKAWQIERAASRMKVMDQVPDKSIKAFTGDVECAIRAAQAQGTQVVLATHATQFGPQYDPGNGVMLTNWRSFYPDLREPGFLDMERRAANSLRELARREDQVTLIDAAASIPGGEHNFADFVHFTDEGAKLMGNLVANAILKTRGDMTASR